MSQPTDDTKPTQSVGEQAPSNPLEHVIEEHPADNPNRMHVARLGAGHFHILEIPGPGGTPFKVWQGPFETDLAARLFLTDHMPEYAAGGSQTSCSQEALDHFNVAARILAFIGNKGSDHTTIAHELARVRPWDRDYYDNLLPF